MAIHIEQERDIQGNSINKTISATAMEMMLDVLQQYQYQFPIKSTVRELISNAIDSTVERDMAKAILSGKKQVEDYFVEIEGAKYKDSKFDSTYYDPTWLSDDMRVRMDYFEGNNLEKDKVVISDNGVGLGGSRLEKYFTLGFSTKRLSKLPLGKFGIGGKAPLSIGVDYFTMESRYNGKLFRFNIYSHTIDSIIPPINLESGQTNEFVTFNEGTEEEYKVYYESLGCFDLNGVTITIEAKKAHKQQYIDAVKSQLLYFDNIVFKIHPNATTDAYSDSSYEVNYKAKILYEDDNIVLSDNAYYNKPHILLNKVNYGYVNFGELELEQKSGNIGLKISPEEVDVNPSRESIIWSDRTKQMVLTKFLAVVDIATAFVEKELLQEDYLKWVRACYSITGKGFSESTIIGRLSRIIDVNEIKPSFLPAPDLKFSQNKVFNGLYTRRVCLEEKQFVGNTKYIIERRDIKAISDAITLPIYLMKQGEKVGNKKDKYLFSQHESGFLLIMEPMTTRESLIESGLTEVAIENILTMINREGENFRALLASTWEYLTKSEDILWYSDVDVPTTFKGTDEEIDIIDFTSERKAAKDRERSEREEKRRLETEAKTKEQAKIASLQRAERRKLEGKTLIYTPRIQEAPTKTNGNDPIKLFSWQKIEIPIKDMNDFSAAEVYYSVGSDELMHLIAMISRDAHYSNILGTLPRRTCGIAKWDDSHQLLSQYSIDSINTYNCQHFFNNKEIMLIKATNANAKYMRDFQPLEEFFHIVKDNTITMSSLLIKWNTARIIKNRLKTSSFLYNYATFSESYSKMYKKLTDYVEDNYREVERYTGYNYYGLDKKTHSDLISHLDKVQQFQEFVAGGGSDQEITSMAKFLFGDNQLQNGRSVDSSILEILKKIEEYAISVGPLLNYIPNLTGYDKFEEDYEKGRTRTNKCIPDELEMSIKNYLEMKGVEEDIEEFYSNLKSEPAPDFIEKEVEDEGESDSIDKEVILYADNEEIARYTPPVKADPSIPDEDLHIPDNQAIYQQF